MRDVPLIPSLTNPSPLGGSCLGAKSVVNPKCGASGHTVGLFIFFIPFILLFHATMNPDVSCSALAIIG